MSRRHTEIQPLIWMLIGIYLVSGINSLAYEVLWARMLSLQFGVSIFGVTTTVAAFMGGLGLGSILGLRYLRAHRSPLILFGILELSLAVYALAIPWLFSWSDKLINSGLHESSITVWYSAQLFASLLLLLIPATVMGAGFPVILRCIKNTNISLGKIYGFNTLGGALGALFPLVLLPNLGWLASTQIIAVLSLLIGLFAIWLSTKLGESLPPDRSEIEVSNQKLITLLAYGGIGAAALMLEVGWTRLLGMIFLRTEYVLAIILAVFTRNRGREFGSKIFIATDLVFDFTDTVRNGRNCQLMADTYIFQMDRVKSIYVIG